MKRSGTGRILFWRGGSLWIGLAGEPTGIHAHHAIQISLAFPRGQVRFQRQGAPWVAYEAAIIAAHEAHAFDARGEFVAQIFVEPESREGKALQMLHSSAGISALEARKLSCEIKALAASYGSQAEDAELIRRACNVVVTLSGQNDAPVSRLDRRIAQALELMRGRRRGAIPLETIAREVNLSADRFRHLFMAEIGMGFRPYILWLRLECALSQYIAGKTLTEAAHEGGFADSAHFSRTFRKMFGIAPASIRPE